MTESEEKCGTEPQKKRKEKAVSLPNMIKSERMGRGSFRRVESLRSF